MAPLRSLLFVCHGNTCRSPMAVAIARSTLRHRSDAAAFTIEGAGVAVRQPGAPADPRAVRCVARHGLDLSWSRARAVEPDDARRFELLLALDRDVERRLRALSPHPASRVRPLMSFAPDAARDEVPDPFHGGPEDYDVAFTLIEQAVHSLMNTIG